MTSIAQKRHWLQTKDPDWLISYSTDAPCDFWTKLADAVRQGKPIMDSINSGFLPMPYRFCAFYCRTGRRRIEAFLVRLPALQQKVRKTKQFNHEARIKEEVYSANESNRP
jgi:hypothetical protein